METYVLATGLSARNLLLWIVIGLIAGWLAGQVMSGHGYGIVGDIVVGLIGSLIAGFVVLHFLHKSLGFVGSLIAAFIGACILVAILHLIQRQPLRT
jgi:uncharacterized membrane protein YeaQ/YmgE (transglycosylase-associated protein family)